MANSRIVEAQLSLTKFYFQVFTEQDSTLRTLFADTWKRFPEETNALVRVHLVNNNLDSKIFKNNLRSLPDAHKNTLLK